MPALRRYLLSPWMPGATLLVVSGLGLAVFGATAASAAFVLWGLAVAVALTVGVAVYQAVRRATLAACVTGASAIVFGGGGLLALFGMALLGSVLDDGPDPFGRDLVIPPELVMRTPLTEGSSPWESAVAADPEGEPLRVACQAPPSSSPGAPIAVGLRALEAFEGSEGRERLLSHLAKSPAWHVTVEDGRRYAYRRFSVGTAKLSSSLNGYYGSPDCGYRVIIGLDGPAMAGPWIAKELATQASAGETVTLRTRGADGSKGLQSYLVVGVEGPSVEIFEDSATADRPLTRAALALVEQELARAQAPSASPGSQAAPQAPAIHLVSGMQGGIYRVQARVNPGEPGQVHLEVYEQTLNTRLSAGRIRQRSTQFVGWSKDPSELFAYDAEITVYEGDWGVYYPARFELWFAPEAGGPSRKLVEDVFRIEGWMR